MLTAENPASNGEGIGRPAPTALVGRVLGGRWTIVRTLGVGGTAVVYEAVHRNGRRVAVKVLHPELAINASVRRRFQSEGYAANRVLHPNAVAVLDDGEEPDNTVYLVMELLEGRSLAARLSEGTALPVDVVASAAMALLDVLAAAHDNGVVHRDIKPANVFETVEGRVKLLDFGAARVREHSTNSPVTQSGSAVGTPAFMSPEQAAGRSEDVDALTDIWAVGATMFQLLTRRLVHDTSSTYGAVVAAATVPAPLVRTVAPSVPPELASVIDRALRFERSERWPNARAMRRALQRACPNVAVEAAAEPPSLDTDSEVLHCSATRSVPPPSRSATVAVLLLLGLVTFGWFAARRMLRPPSSTDHLTVSTQSGPVRTLLAPEPTPSAAPLASATGSSSLVPSGRPTQRAPGVAATATLHSAKPRPAARPADSAVTESDETLLDRRK